MPKEFDRAGNLRPVYERYPGTIGFLAADTVGGVSTTLLTGLKQSEAEGAAIGTGVVLVLTLISYLRERKWAKSSEPQ